MLEGGGGAGSPPLAYAAARTDLMRTCSSGSFKRSAMRCARSITGNASVGAAVALYATAK